ncbi:hypothetical protein [Sandaracinobacteroides saxicola]|uniref:Holin n=1 Tax=Sandaracinobacteroides saxicola TaxID=2759707 RepID=A0A7G5IJ34_9SPHN|nr:hypothetical protein [Sandaracinobacteroides saxicola]QMW23376.1 hypothetical protein H3309_02415 [Sandaracinobacteroides saxicola]
MKKIWAWLRARAVEPSTWTGVAVIAGSLGAHPEQALTIAQGIGLVVGGTLIGTPRGVSREIMGGDA